MASTGIGTQFVMDDLRRATFSQDPKILTETMDTMTPEQLASLQKIVGMLEQRMPEIMKQLGPDNLVTQTLKDIQNSDQSGFLQRNIVDPSARALVGQQNKLRAATNNPFSSDFQKVQAGATTSSNRLMMDQITSAQMQLQDRRLQAAGLSSQRTQGVNSQMQQVLDSMAGITAIPRIENIAAYQPYKTGAAETGAHAFTNKAGSSFMSDERRKHNIEDIDGALEKVQQIRGVTWNWNESGEADAGVLAQEVQAVAPELVVTHNGTLYVNYTGLLGLVLAAVNELADKVGE